MSPQHKSPTAQVSWAPLESHDVNTMSKLTALTQLRKTPGKKVVPGSRYEDAPARGSQSSHLYSRDSRNSFCHSRSTTPLTAPLTDYFVQTQQPDGRDDVAGVQVCVQEQTPSRVRTS